MISWVLSPDRCRRKIQFSKAIAKVAPNTTTSTLPARLSTTPQKTMPMSVKSGPMGKRNFATPKRFHRKVGSALQTST